MTYDPSFKTRSRQFFQNMIGRGGAVSDDAGKNHYPEQLRRRSDFNAQDSEHILEGIKLFFAENDLVLTPPNLLAVYSAFSGANPRLHRKIALQLKAGEPITQAWFNSQIKPDSSDRDLAEKLDTMADRLKVSVSHFQKTAHTARSAVHDYGRSMEKHIDEMGDCDEMTDRTLANWMDVSERMIASSLEFERRLRKSESEAQKLRGELEQARRQATIDHLTELPNRRGFDALLEQEVRSANANVEPLVVALCDIDRFKLVNDTWGHETGDRIIKAVARELAKLTDDKCHAARHGGEEFVMLFRGLTLEEALARLDTTRIALSRRRFVKEASEEVIGTVTFSGGIADVFAYENPRLALRAADDALYRAKEQGRDRIETATG